MSKVKRKWYRAADGFYRAPDFIMDATWSIYIDDSGVLTYKRLSPSESATLVSDPITLAILNQIFRHKITEVL